MSVHIVRVDEVAPQPWRNGGGQTRELMAWPPGPDWQLRVSVADIDRDGPFSAFPGVQRWFTVLQGAGVWLGEPALRLEPHSPPHGFDGASAPACRLIDGPTRDLNLMARAGHGLSEMHAARPGLPWQPAPGGAEWRALFCADAVQLELGDGPLRLSLPAMTLVWSAEARGAWTVTGPDGARAWWMQRAAVETSR